MTYSLIAHTLVQAASGGGSSTTITTSAINTTGADLLVLVACHTSTISVSDNKGNTFTGRTIYGTSPILQIYDCQGGSVGTGHTFSLTSTFPSLAVAAFSGSVASPYDQANGGSGTSPGAITPTQNNELIICGLAGRDSTSQTISSPFTLLDFGTYDGTNHFSIGLAYYIQTTAASINPTWSSSQTVNIASYKASTGAPTSSLFRQNPLSGIGSGGPFFSNPIGRSMLGWRPKLVTA